MNAVTRTLTKARLFGLLLLALFTLPTAAQAIPITVRGVDYNIEWQIGTFNEVNAGGLLERQAWWGNSGIAGLLALALGFQNDGDGDIGLGPYFAVLPRGPSIISGLASRSTGFGSRVFLVAPATDVRAWAYDAPVAVSEPASWALLALGLVGFGVARKRRQ